MDSSDYEVNQRPQLNMMGEVEKAKIELGLQKHKKGKWERWLLRFPKSRSYLVATILLGLVVSIVVIVLILNSDDGGPTITESLSNGPCDNFYEFSCRRWNEENPRPEWITKWNVFSALERKSTKLVSEILEEPFEDDDIEAVRQAKSLYKKCLDNYTGEFNLIRVLSTMSGMQLVEETEGGNKSSRPKNETCAELVQKQFTSVLVHKYVMRKYPDLIHFKKVRTEVQQMFDNIKTVFDNADTPLFSKFAKDTKVCIGFPDWMLNSTSVQSKFQGFLLAEDKEFDVQLTRTILWKMTQQLRTFLMTNDSAECWKYRSDIILTAGSVHTQISKSNRSSILIHIPLGLLEPPFFRLDQSKAKNYGSLGQIIGHELAHAYLELEWNNSTDKDIGSLAECLNRQYSAFTSDKSVTLNGELTLSENLPDNLGLLASYIAYSKIDGGSQYEMDVSTNVDVSDEHESTSREQDIPSFSQLTADQIFFLSFSQTWCASTSMDDMEKQMQDSKHAPGIFRALGTLQNSKEFAKSWNCSIQSTGSQKTCQPFLAKYMASSN